jgi:hypothetical protein
MHRDNIARAVVAGDLLGCVRTAVRTAGASGARTLRIRCANRESRK